MDQATPHPAAGSALPEASTQAAACGPRLLTGRVFSAILGEDGPERAVLVDATAAALGHLGVRLVRVGNPLRSPLTLERMLIQIGAGEDGGPPAGDNGGMVEVLRAHRTHESRVVLVVEQAETLEPRALAHLQCVSDAFEATEPGVRVLFIGAPAFLSQLERAGAQRIRSELTASWAGEMPAVDFGAPQAAVAIASALEQGASAPPPRDTLSASPDQPRARRGMRWLAVEEHFATAAARGTTRQRRALAFAALSAVLCLMAGVAVLGGFGSLPHRRPSSDGAGAAGPRSPPAAALALPAGQAPATQLPSPDSDPASPPLQTAGPVPPIAAPVGSTQPSSPGTAPAPQPPLSAYEEQRARLQREFDAFLDAYGRSTSRLDAAQRQALFEEFLDWRARNPGDGAADGSPPLTRRVVVYHRAGSAAGEAEVGRVAEALRPGAEGVEVRALDGDPSAPPTVRYFYPEDEAAARAVIRSMQAVDLGLGWEARDSSKDPLKPPPGTVEVWLLTR
jgi:hypothetical protein